MIPSDDKCRRNLQRETLSFVTRVHKSFLHLFVLSSLLVYFFYHLFVLFLLCLPCFCGCSGKKESSVCTQLSSLSKLSISARITSQKKRKKSLNMLLFLNAGFFFFFLKRRECLDEESLPLLGLLLSISLSILGTLFSTELWMVSSRLAQ